MEDKPDSYLISEIHKRNQQIIDFLYPSNKTVITQARQTFMGKAKQMADPNFGLAHFANLNSQQEMTDKAQQLSQSINESTEKLNKAILDIKDIFSQKINNAKQKIQKEIEEVVKSKKLITISQIAFSTIQKWFEVQQKKDQTDKSIDNKIQLQIQKILEQIQDENKILNSNNTDPLQFYKNVNLIQQTLQKFITIKKLNFNLINQFNIIGYNVRSYPAKNQRLKNGQINIECQTQIIKQRMILEQIKTMTSRPSFIVLIETMANKQGGIITIDPEYIVVYQTPISVGNQTPAQGVALLADRNIVHRGFDVSKLQYIDDNKLDEMKKKIKTNIQPYNQGNLIPNKEFLMHYQADTYNFVIGGIHCYNKGNQQIIQRNKILYLLELIRNQYAVQLQRTYLLIIYVDLNLDYQRDEDLKLFRQFRDELKKIGYTIVQPDNTT